jgi:hypothetical protein
LAPLITGLDGGAPFGRDSPARDCLVETAETGPTLVKGCASNHLSCPRLPCLPTTRLWSSMAALDTKKQFQRGQGRKEAELAAAWEKRFRPANHAAHGEAVTCLPLTPRIESRSGKRLPAPRRASRREGIEGGRASCSLRGELAGLRAPRRASLSTRVEGSERQSPRHRARCQVKDWAWSELRDSIPVAESP